MSDHGSRTEARSERATSVHSHYSHDSRNRDRDEDPDARRRRKEADREYERQRDRERQREGSTARSHRHSSRDYDHDRTREYDDDHRRRRAHDYDRERNRDRDLDPAGPAPDDADDYDRAHKRRRSSSRDYDRDRDYDRERERERERRHSRPYDDYYDHGRRSSRRGHDYDDRPPPRRRRSPSYEPPRRQRSPELTEEQREMRSVFVSQLAARVTDRELGIFFEHHAGKVRDARVIVDRISRRSKGVGYVEFVELETVQKALTLSGTKLLGIPVQVQYTEAEKNRQARDGTSGASNGERGGSGSAPMTGGLYVGSLNFALTSDDIREVFQPFGELEAVELHRDLATGKSKGYCFVKFKEHKDAMVAIEKMNNFPLAGREIKVGLVADRSATFSQHVGAQQQQEGQLEREEHTGKLDANTRIELMQKLSRVDRPPDLPPTPMFRPNIPQNITRNVLMKNAFNPEEETERDWDLELADDVKTECEDKYGPVVDIYVVKESTEGEIYIRFASPDVAVKALQGLNGRWFGGKQIAASHVGDSLFDAKK